MLIFLLAISCDSPQKACFDKAMAWCDCWNMYCEPEEKMKDECENTDIPEEDIEFYRCYADALWEHCEESEEVASKAALACESKLP